MTSSRRTSTGRPKLDRDAVVGAALDVADAEGLEAVTIRRLAQLLHVTPMALYWHFEDKDALLAGMAGRLLEDTIALLRQGLAERGVTDWPATGTVGAADEPDGWGRLRLLLRSLVTAFRRHPAVAGLVHEVILDSEPGLVLTEWALEVLASKGFDEETSAEVARLALAGAIMLVDVEPGADIPQAPRRDELQRRKQLSLASLPADRYPRVSAAAVHLTHCDEERHFAGGVEVLVAGIRSRAPLGA